MALKWEDIDFEERELHVKGSLCRVDIGTGEDGNVIHTYKVLSPKTVKSRRTIPLTDVAIDALRLQQERQMKMKEYYKDIYNDEGFVFARYDGRYLNQRGFMDEYHAFLKKYNIPDIRFHDLRHPYVKPTTKKFASFLKFFRAAAIAARSCSIRYSWLIPPSQISPILKSLA